MYKPIKSILFATNLLPSCRSAFEFSISIAFKYQAKLFLLNVHEDKGLKYVEDMVQDFLGKGEWEKIQKRTLNSTRDELIGKVTAEKLTKEALEYLCGKAGINSKNCKNLNYEVLVEKGDIIDSILFLSEKEGCDLIVMGAREGFFESNSIGFKVKGVMRQSKIPVLFVPPYSDEKN